jgi:hypothetical protein
MTDLMLPGGSRSDQWHFIQVIDRSQGITMDCARDMAIPTFDDRT